MKKITFLSVAIAAAGLLFYGMLNSCGKEEPQINPSEQIHENQMQTDNLLVNGLIESFKNRMTYYKANPDLKSGEYMSLDSAIWYIDATLNYTYANASHPYAKLHWDTANFELNVINENEVNFEEVFQAYDSALIQLSDAYYRITEKDKQFIMVRVKDMGSLSMNLRDLRIVTITGTGTSINDYPWGDDEEYKFNMEASTDCSGAPSTGATEHFETALGNLYNTHPSPNCRYYFYGSEIIIPFNYYDYQNNDILTPPNYLDYKIFAASEEAGPITDETECLDWNQHELEIHEMNYYFEQLVILIDEWISSPANSMNKRYAISEIESWQSFPNGFEIIYHKPYITFRNRAVVCEEPILPPEE